MVCVLYFQSLPKLLVRNFGRFWMEDTGEEKGADENG